MMLIGAAAFGPTAAPGDVVRTILPDVSSGNNAWHREYHDKSGVFVYNSSGDGADAYSMDLNGDGVEDFRIQGESVLNQTHPATARPGFRPPADGLEIVSHDGCKRMYVPIL